MGGRAECISKFRRCPSCPAARGRSRPRRARVALMNRRHLSRRILVWAVQRGHRMSSSGMTAAYVRVSNVCPRSTRICAVVAAHKSGRQLLGRPFMWAGLTLVRSQESRALRALVQTTSMLRSNASARKIDAHYVRSGAARGCLQRQPTLTDMSLARTTLVGDASTARIGVQRCTVTAGVTFTLLLGHFPRPRRS